MTNPLGQLFTHFSPTRRRQLFFLVPLMVVASLSEIISIGAVIPFLGILTAPERILNYKPATPLLLMLGIENSEDLLLPIVILFCLAAIFCGAIRLTLLWITTKLSFALGTDLSSAIYKRTLYQPYSVHISRNSSELISGISIKVNSVIYDTLNPLLTAISSMFILIVILTALVILKPLLALMTFIGFGGVYLLIVKITRNKLKVNSRQISLDSIKVIKVLQEGLGGIRDVLIDGTQDVYSEIYHRADFSYRTAQARNQFIGSCPRYIVEALGMSLIAIFAYFLVRREGDIALPILGVFALGAQRLLPLFQQIYTAWSGMKGNQDNLRDALNLLNQSLPDTSNYLEVKKIEFCSKIKLDNICFRYSDSNSLVLNNVSLNIPRGSRVGFVGSTGSGKSTLVDIIMGLLSPSSGTLSVDGVAITDANCVSWRSLIAHVPQSIYLTDATVAENIAFGISKENIDSDRVKRAATQAQIDADILTWDGGYDAQVGERGVRLSGGQRQRIGIARALYKQAEIIIFDEATSALDVKTEGSVMRAIEALSPNLTIIIIAHRLSTLVGCDAIIEISNGSLSLNQSNGKITV